MPDTTLVPIENKSIPATTTFQQDVTTAGQRKVNLIWEYTQALIAITVIGVTLFTDAYVTVTSILSNKELTVTQLVGVSNLTALSMLIAGFYFSRTNHAAIGGIGAKPSEPYIGR